MWRRVPRRWLIYGLLAFCGAAAVYVGYLDYTVTSQFESKRWSLPARVYARPLDLYAGKRLDARQFDYELRLLRYLPVAQPAFPGTYHRSGDEYSFITRPFTFWDGQQAPMPVKAVFSGGQLVSLQQASTGAPLTLVRMNPVLIGGIYPARKEDRILVRLQDVPPYLLKGLIAVEDRDFYQHPGIDPRAIARALVADLRAGRFVEGGSTLTQQLVRNFFLTNRRTLWRKLNEAIMALLLEWHYSKRAILETYCNEVYLGQDGAHSIHGFGLASEFYFARPLSELKLHQMALLIALVRGPSYYDPRRFPRHALQRRKLVLQIMAERGVITSEQARHAAAQPLDVVPRTPSAITRYPAFIDLVRRQLSQDYREQDLTTGGLRIFTTLDPLVQHAADLALEHRVRWLERAHRLPAGQLQGAAVVCSTQNGDVLGLVGGRDPHFAGFNRALDAVRQVGSVIKPAVYLTALGQPQKYTLATLLDDDALSVKLPNGTVWAPHNYDRQYHGRVPVYSALAHSYNIATVRLGLAVGVPPVVDTLQRLGVQRQVSDYPSLFLGAAALSPYDVAQMYETLAGGGFRTPLRAIVAVLTAQGKPLQRYPLKVEQAFDPAPVYLVDTALQDVVREGTASYLYQMLPPDLNIAGKTGTTEDMRDSWFAGFTGDRLAVAWVGMDDNQPTGLSGASGAMLVWGDIIRSIGARPLQLDRPSNVVDAWIDPATGLQTDQDCPGSVRLPFIQGSVPQQFAPCAGGATNNPVQRTFDWFRRLFR